MENEDEKTQMDILFQLARMKQNQIEFRKAITDFFDDMLTDDTEENKSDN